MSICSLSKTFRRLTIVGKDICTQKYHTAKHVNCTKAFAAINLQTIRSNEEQCKSTKDYLINFSARSINVNVNLPPGIPTINNIIESPVINKYEIQNPMQKIIEKIDITPERQLDLPMYGNTQSKECRKLSIIIIRRKKVKKHKRRKWRNNHEAELRKINKRRGVKREKMFQAELWAKVKEAQKFDAKEYVASRLKLYKWKPIPLVYKGHIVSEELSMKLIEQERLKKEKRRNMPRLTL